MPNDSRIEVTVINFRPYWEGSCSVEMELKTKTPNPHGVPPTVSSDGVVTLSGPYHASIDRGSAGKAKYEVKFWAVPNDQYQLVGIVFKSGPATNPRGTHVFQSSVKLEPMIPTSPDVSTVTLTVDTTVALLVAPPERYEFMLLVQRASDGELGLIDPDWENEN